MNRDLLMKIAVGVVVVAVAYFLYSSYEGFDDGNNKKTLVLFYAPWCGHCQKLKPTWEQLVKKHTNDSTVDIKSVDCDQHPEQAKENGVEGFPTIILIKGNTKIPFTGDRSLESIEQFINSV